MMNPVAPVEIKHSNRKDYYIRGSWEARSESPEGLATRFLRNIDSLKLINPVFSLWACGRKRPATLEKVRERYADEITEGVTRDDWGKPQPADGYWFGAHTRGTPVGRTFALRCCAGATVRSSFPNDVTLETCPYVNVEPDADVVAFGVFHDAVLTIVDAWEPVRAGAYSRPLIQMNANASRFPKAWIQYLCPWLATKITPPASALVERLPNGGLLMSATTETFDVNNPQHLAAASDMQAAMAPLEKLPWPSQG